MGLFGTEIFLPLVWVIRVQNCLEKSEKLKVLHGIWYCASKSWDGLFVSFWRIFYWKFQLPKKITWNFRKIWPGNNLKFQFLEVLGTMIILPMWKEENRTSRLVCLRFSYYEGSSMIISNLELSLWSRRATDEISVIICDDPSVEETLFIYLRAW